MKRVISVLVENKFGVLAKVSGLFAARGYNIYSLVVGETEDPTISRMTIVASGDDKILDQIIRQLNRLIDVLEVVNLTDQQVVIRESALIKVMSDKKARREILVEIGLIEKVKVNYIDPDNGNMVVEITASERKINDLIALLRSYSRIEVVRSGVIAISREIEVGKNIRHKKTSRR